MTKSTIWKIVFILFLALISFSLITPFEDQEMGEYANSQAGTTADGSKYPGHESFSDVFGAQTPPFRHCESLVHAAPGVGPPEHTDSSELVPSA